MIEKYHENQNRFKMMKDQEVNELKTKAKKDLEHTKKYYQKKSIKLPEITTQSYIEKQSHKEVA